VLFSKFYNSFSIVREGDDLIEDILCLVKFYEGGLSYGDLMDMPLLELITVFEQTNKIARSTNG